MLGACYFFPEFIPDTTVVGFKLKNSPTRQDMDIKCTNHISKQIIYKVDQAVIMAEVQMTPWRIRSALQSLLSCLGFGSDPTNCSDC